MATNKMAATQGTLIEFPAILAFTWLDKPSRHKGGAEQDLPCSHVTGIMCEAIISVPESKRCLSWQRVVLRKGKPRGDVKAG